jgi:hypothetical protein
MGGQDVATATPVVRLKPGDYSCLTFRAASPPSTWHGEPNQASMPNGGGAEQQPGRRMLVRRGEA